MKARTVLLVDSEERAFAALQEHTKRLPFFAPPKVCNSLHAAIHTLNQQSFDLIMVDLVLSDMIGVDVLSILPRKAPIIVTTSKPDYAVDCFDFNIADFLLKPFDFARFTRAVNRALDVRLTPNGFFDKEVVFIKVGRNIQRFFYDEIDYIEAMGNYSKLWIGKKVIVVNETISALEERLPARRFLRIHKSYIINLTNLTTYNYSQLTVGDSQVPLGTTYREYFENYLSCLNATD